MPTTLSSVRTKHSSQKYCGFQIGIRDDDQEGVFYWPLPSNIPASRHAVLITLNGDQLSGTYMNFNPRTGAFEQMDLPDSEVLEYYNRLGLVADVLPPAPLP